jgi:AraC-like DNA-binding protein
MTAQRYIQNKIIDLSKRDLLGSELPVSEIAYQLGFDYPQHFTRLFKKQTGLSPAEYRKTK